MHIDLHLHTNASDGALAPAAVVAAARAGGLDVIAISDHDTVTGLAAAQAAAVGRVELIPAIELSSTLDGRELHILGYCVDPADPALLTYTRRARIRRIERMHGMLDLLEGVGVSVGFDAVIAAAGDDEAHVGRAHLARVLVERGHVRSFGEAFERWIGDAAPCFLPVALLTPEAAVALLHGAGGLAVWAHPPADLFGNALDDLVNYGLDGVECLRPRNTAAEAAGFTAEARGRGLIVTGGSDWHGEWHGRLGEFFVTEEDVPELLAHAGVG